MYELAAEDDQRYKEAKVILEKALVREKDGIQELEVTNWLTWKTFTTNTSAQSINSPLGKTKVMSKVQILIYYKLGQFMIL